MGVTKWTSLLVIGSMGCTGVSKDDTTVEETGPELDSGPDTVVTTDTDLAGDSDTDPAGDTDGGTDSDVALPDQGVVHVVLFTHIEDNTPLGALGSEISRLSYLGLRGRLIELAELAEQRNLQWVVQPDWTFLEAALLYEDSELTSTTDGKNLFLYLHDELGVVIDPHSHESGGYNYTDVAYLLEQLGVGGSTVIGGHVWDPELAEFQEWDRFRDPVPGLHYPEAVWRGDILIGAGTPNHYNDPLLSGVWRPQDPEHFFDDDPQGNILAVGAWHDDVAGVEELVGLYADGTVPPGVMLTASWNLTPTVLLSEDGPAQIDATVLEPMAELRDQGLVVVTDFSTLTEIWASDYGSQAYVYSP